MSITQTVEIPDNHRLVIDVPREVPAGPVILTFTPRETVQKQKKEHGFGCLKGQIKMSDDFNEPLVEQNIIPVFGCAKGKYRMADDFDAPLEDFKDYM